MATQVVVTDMTALRRNMEDSMEHAKRNKRHTMVTKHGKSIAVIIPLEHHSLLMAVMANPELLAAAQASLEAPQPKTGADIALAIQRDFKFPGDDE